MLQSLSGVGTQPLSPSNLHLHSRFVAPFKGSCKTAAISLDHADSNLYRPPRRQQRARIRGPKLQEPTPLRPREVGLAQREEGGASRRDRRDTPTRRWPRALRGSERGPGPREGPF